MAFLNGFAAPADAVQDSPIGLRTAWGGGMGTESGSEPWPGGGVSALLSEIRKKSPDDPRVVLLVVEDNQGDVYLVRKAIEFHHVPVRIVVAEDGEQALEYFRRASNDDSVSCPAVLLLDLNLPKRSGVEVLEAVRKCGKCCHVPVVVITSSDSPKDRERTAKLGADRYFRKPSKFEEFMKIGEVLNEVLQSHP